MKVKADYVPEINADYLTTGKEYDFDEEFNGVAGYITDDQGEFIYIQLAHSSHLNGKPWIVIKKDQEQT
jgi:hypothetical protein